MLQLHIPLEGKHHAPSISDITPTDSIPRLLRRSTTFCKEILALSPWSFACEVLPPSRCAANTTDDTRCTGVLKERTFFSNKLG
eukprot:2783609-Pyramimonas_sp.AAC.1